MSEHDWGHAEGDCGCDECAGVTAEELIKLAIEALPVHKISGYEWECWEPDTGCHYHWSNDATCSRGHPVTTEGNYDRDGRPCGHDALLDRAAVLALFAPTSKTP